MCLWERTRVCLCERVCVFSNKGWYNHISYHRHTLHAPLPGLTSFEDFGNSPVAGCQMLIWEHFGSLIKLKYYAIAVQSKPGRHKSNQRQQKVTIVHQNRSGAGLPLWTEPAGFCSHLFVSHFLNTNWLKAEMWSLEEHSEITFDFTWSKFSADFSGS